MRNPTCCQRHWLRALLACVLEHKTKCNSGRFPVAFLFLLMNQGERGGRAGELGLRLQPTRALPRAGSPSLPGSSKWAQLAWRQASGCKAATRPCPWSSEQSLFPGAAPRLQHKMPGRVWWQVQGAGMITPASLGQSLSHGPGRIKTQLSGSTWPAGSRPLTA